MSTKGHTLQLYEVRSFLRKNGATGVDAENFYIRTGSRVLVTFRVTALDAGTSVRLRVKNAEDVETPHDLLDTLDISAPGVLKRVYSDFNPYFVLETEVLGPGAASFKVGVAVFDNASTTKIENAQLAVDLSHVADALGHFDSVRIGDGTDLLDLNPNGSLNAVIQDAADEVTTNPYGEAAAVPSGVETTLVTYTVPALTQAFLQRAECSGENIGRYKIYVNGSPIACQRTYFGGDLNARFDFVGPQKQTRPLQPGDVVTVTVLHGRPATGAFEARLQVVEKG
jgi:hypothetical protein